MSGDGGQPGEAAPLDGRKLTWAALLGQWVEFARSALALPDDEQGRRLRESVADIIMLQAVWHALGHLDELSRQQRALGLDRAQVLIDKHAQALTHRWSDQAMPALLQELIEDAQNRLTQVSSSGDNQFR